jgi:hypothetical protein
MIQSEFNTIVQTLSASALNCCSDGGWMCSAELPTAVSASKTSKSCGLGSAGGLEVWDSPATRPTQSRT